MIAQESLAEMTRVLKLKIFEVKQLLRALGMGLGMQFASRDSDAGEQ